MNQPSTKAEDIPVVDHDQTARDWLANVYQGDPVRQLSVRLVDWSRHFRR